MPVLPRKQLQEVVKVLKHCGHGLTPSLPNLQSGQTCDCLDQMSMPEVTLGDSQKWVIKDDATSTCMLEHSCLES